jgi:hypothetical protein
MSDTRWAIACVAFLAHNAEEILLELPGWTSVQPELTFMTMAMPAERYLPVVLTVSFLVIGLAIWGTLKPSAKSEGVLKVFAVIMLINALVHIGLSIYSGSAMPGTYSAIVILLPVMGWIVVTRPQAP